MPTPRIGGIAIWFAVVSALAIGGVIRQPAVQWITLGCVVLGGVALVDDFRGLSQILRLAIQSLVAAFTIFLLPTVDWYPIWISGDAFLFVAAGAVFWVVWLANTNNFMDGINGLAATNTIICGLVYFVLFERLGLIPEAVLSIAVMGAAAGFLPWNFPNAKVFMGDVGSIPIGYLLGCLSLNLAAHGVWAAALLPLLPFLSDTSSTLAIRVVTGQKFWMAHRTHHYQLAAIRLRSHTQVTIIWGIASAIGGVLALATDLIPQPWFTASVIALCATLIVGGLAIRASAYRSATGEQG